MANHKSAEKRFRRDEKRTTLNHQRVSRIRTFIKKVEKAILSGIKVDAQTAFKEAMPEFLANCHVYLAVLKRLLNFKFSLFSI